MGARIKLVRQGLRRECGEAEVEALCRKGWKLVPEKSGAASKPAAKRKRKPRKKNIY
jgi:hypothetical protein